MIDSLDLFDSRVVRGPLSNCGLKSAAYIYGSFEERSNHFDINDPELSHLTFYEVMEEEDDGIVVSGYGRFPRANIGRLADFIKSIEAEQVYIDVTGLCHSVWAPLLKLSLSLKKKLSIIYVEPRDYKKSENPAAGLIYDLSEKTQGIAPIPGFASFPSKDDEDYLFAAFLGFEGPRFFHALEQLEPESDTVFPIIGVPGYQPEYPFYTFEGNALPLRSTKYQAWKNMRFASASCPFSAFRALEGLKAEFPNKRVKLGLFGTKPHAIGAILFRLVYPKISELIYDHPVRKLKRTSGAKDKHIFDISDFLENKQSFRAGVSMGRLR